jgi:KDO2-lipid IV(A) lauroyltransferase
MSKPRSALVDCLVYAVVRFIVCVIQALPVNAAAGVAGALAWLAYRVNRRHREVARDNLRRAFPELSPQQIDQRIREVYRHFCGLLMDILHTPRKLNTHNWRDYVAMEHVGKPLVEALLSDRPLLIVTGHFGNWEMGGYVLGLLGFPTHAIARQLDNRYLNEFLGRFRGRTGQKILDKNRDYELMKQVLAEGGVLATLGDQDAGQRGLFVDFFGRPASTHKAIALFALEYRVPMLVMGMRRQARPLHYHVVMEDVILPEEYADRPDAVRAMTERFTAAFEHVVRQAPEQYFWLHRRWKHEPPKKKAKKAA